MKKFLSKQKYQIYFAGVCGTYFIGRIIVQLIFNL
jgi:hypothetical protein